MATDDLDELIDQAKPSGLVPAAAGVVGLHGLLVLAAGVQAYLSLSPTGALAFFPPALVVVGLLTGLAAYAMSSFIRVLGALAPLFALAAAALSGAWFLVCTSQLIILPGAMLAAAVAPLSALLSLLALPAWLKCARARAKLAKELGEDAPKEAGLGGLVVVALILIALGAAAFAVLGGLSVGDPLVVAIVRRGAIDDLGDANLARDFGRALEDRGLLPTLIDAPLAADAPFESARAAARTAGAGHVVVLDLATEAERDGVVHGTSLFAVTATVSVAGTGRSDPEPDSSETLEFAYEAASPTGVVYDVAETWVDVLTPFILDALYHRASFEPVLNNQVATSQLGSARKLIQLRDAVQARRDRAVEWTDYCAAQAAELAAATDAESAVTCLGDPCRPYSVVGVTAEGHAVIQEGSRRPMFAIPPSVKPMWTEEPERLFVVDPANPTQERPLMRSGNFYDLAKVDADGKYAVVETFGAGDAEAVVTIDLATREPKDVAVLGRRQRTQWVRPGLDGGPALVQLRRSNAGLIWADGGTDFPALERGEWVRTPAGDRVLAQIGDEATLLDEAGERSGKLPIEVWMRGVGFDADALYVVDGQGPCRLRTVDPKSLRVRSTKEFDCLRRPRRLADGRWLGVAPASAEGDAPGDDEVVLWDPAVDAYVPLTANTLREESAFPTPDGTRAWFNRRLDEWPAKFNTRLYRRQACFVDIP